MRIDILTVVPELLASPLNESILKRAQEKGLVEIHIHNIRDYTEDKHRTTDDYPFGGEAGMVMKIEPIYRCIEALKAEREYDEVIYTSPDGIRYDQHEANRLSTLDNLIILCGHYKGIDYRIREHLVTREPSGRSNNPFLLEMMIILGIIIRAKLIASTKPIKIIIK